MTTRRKHLFVTPGEFADWIRDLSRDISLTALLYRGTAEPLKPWSGDDDELAACERIFLAADVPQLNTIRTDKLKPGKYGWVEFDVPRVAGHALLLCQIAAKSDWFDEQQSKVLQNPDALRLYDKVWRRLKKRVTFPVWAYNKVNGGEAIPYRSIGYSNSAKEWSRSGGVLAQDGVDNIQFEIHDP